jgi:hypothetical protein
VVASVVAGISGGWGIEPGWAVAAALGGRMFALVPLFRGARVGHQAAN